MSRALREENRQVALILTNTLGTLPVYPTGVALADSTPMHVAVVNGSGDQITSFGGGTQYAVDTASGGTDTGTLALAVRDDILSTLTPIDGDYTQLRVSSVGSLWTRIDTTGGSVDVIPSDQLDWGIQNEDGPHFSGDKGVPAWGVRNDTASTAFTNTNGDYNPLAVDSHGRLFVTGDASMVAIKTDGSAVTQPVAGNVASAATDSGNPVKVGGKYNATAPTFTDGQRGDVQLDVNGNVKVTEATLLAGEDLTNNVIKVEQRFSYSNIATNTTTTVKSGAGFLHCIVINTHGGGANTATVYDNTAGSGTKIGTIDTTTGGENRLYDVSFSTGLTIVTATGTAADITISYR